MLYLALIIPILSFILQSYPRFFNKYFGVDVWSRMLEADLIRKNGHRIPMNKISNGFLLEGYFNYPPVFPWLLSFMPKKKLLEIQGFIAPIFDIFQNVFVFLFTFQITNRIEISLLAQLIYGTIPLNALENSYLTPRSLGYLNLTLAFYPLLLYSISPNPLYILASFIFTVLIFFTHKFATQSLFFLSIFFTIFEKDFLYLGIFLLGLISAILISKGYYFRIFKGHIGNILFWFKNYNYRFAHQIRGVMHSKSTETDFVGKLYNLMRLFSPLALLSTNLWMTLPILYIGANIFDSPIFVQNILYYKMSLWIIFFYVFSIGVLSFKFLIPIGEGQRYLEMATAPTAILSSIFLFSLFEAGFEFPAIIFTLIILLINLSLIFFLQWKGIIKDKNRSVTGGMTEAFYFINKLKPTPRILCIPHQITTMVLYNTNAKVLVDIESGTLPKIGNVFPVMKDSVINISKKYGLDILVLKKDYATMKELNIGKDALLFESGDTQVIKLRKIS